MAPLPRGRPQGPRPTGRGPGPRRPPQPHRRRRLAHGRMDRTPARTTRTGIAEPIDERSAVAVLTTWRRLRDWNEAAVWQQMREVLLADLNAAGPSRLVACGRRLQQRAGRRKGSRTGPSPVDRGRTRSKHHLITDGHCTPLTVTSPEAAATASPCPCSTPSHPSGAGPGVPAQAGRAHRRPRIRPRPLPRPAPTTPHPPSHRPVAAPCTAQHSAPSSGATNAASPDSAAAYASASAKASKTPSSSPPAASSTPTDRAIV